MDAKITLSFDERVIKKAKQYAEKQNISLSRLMEMLLDKITANNYKNLEEMPIADWVNEISEGKSQYLIKQKKRSALKKDFFEKRK
jgi:antitoxin component of RelBE/YafQ-DinJ toxin-antitoxin module